MGLFSFLTTLPSKVINILHDSWLRTMQRGSILLTMNKMTMWVFEPKVNKVALDVRRKPIVVHVLGRSDGDHWGFGIMHTLD